MLSTKLQAMTALHREMLGSFCERHSELLRRTAGVFCVCFDHDTESSETDLYFFKSSVCRA